jgi:hypothetical protein
MPSRRARSLPIRRGDSGRPPAWRRQTAWRRRAQAVLGRCWRRRCRTRLGKQGFYADAGGWTLIHADGPAFGTDVHGEHCPAGLDEPWRCDGRCPIRVHRRASACICVEPCLPCRTPQCAARDPGRRLPARTPIPGNAARQLRSAASPRRRRSGRQSKQKMEPQMHTDGLQFGMLVQGRTQPAALDEQRCRVGPESISVYRYASVVPFSCLPCRVSHPAQRALGSRCPARTPPRTPHRAPARHGTRLDHPAPRRLVFGTLPWRRHPMSSGPHVEIIAPQAIPPRTGRGSTPCTRTALPRLVLSI